MSTSSKNDTPNPEQSQQREQGHTQNEENQPSPQRRAESTPGHTPHVTPTHASPPLGPHGGFAGVHPLMQSPLHFPFRASQQPDFQPTRIMLHYQSISCSQPYRHLSFEEIRMLDYSNGLKVPAMNFARAGQPVDFFSELDTPPGVPPGALSGFPPGFPPGALPGFPPGAQPGAQQSPKPSGNSIAAARKVIDAIDELFQSENVDVQVDTKLRNTSILIPLPTWAQVSKMFNLVPSSGRRQFPTFNYTRCFLPPSFRERVMVDAALWLDVYRDGEARNGDSGLRIMDVWHVPVCGLFRGRLFDQPQSCLPKTQYPSGIAVDHQVYMSEGIILLVIEMKITLERPELDNIAQVLLELAAAHGHNSAERPSDKPPAVFALLTDMKTFQVYSFDGVKFSQAQEKLVSSQSRFELMRGMVSVMDIIFSLLLHGYISNLRAGVSRSTGSSDAGSSDPRPSLDDYSKALAKAEEAQKTLEKQDRTNREAADIQGKRGLDLLTQSVECFPKYGHYKEVLDEKPSEDVIRDVLDALYDAP